MDDIVTLQRRIDHLTRAAGLIRAHLADLHTLAWERTNAGNEKVRESKVDHVPAVADLAPPARLLWNQTEQTLERIEAILVGLERKVTGYFMVTAILEPTRGSLIPATEHERLLANQRARRKAGDYTPERLIDQAPHPGRKR